MSKYYTVSEFANAVGVTAQTVRNWEKSGELMPHHRADNGFRYYSNAEIRKCLEKRKVVKSVIVYCSASRKEYMIEKAVCMGRPFEIVTDLSTLIDYIEQDKVDIIVVENPDIFGVYKNVLEIIAKHHDVQINKLEDMQK